jgi:predicted ATP-dependent endonuclease of OLD family
MGDIACFWSVDLHVHTPASQDAPPDAYSDAVGLVSAARSAGLDAIAITDHNTADWCDDIGRAAEGLPIVVLPGVEITTTEGHLLAIWEQGTPARVINELLAIIGIGEDDRGALTSVANGGIEDTARAVTAHDGLAIAAHIEKPKGLLEISVASHLLRTLMDDSLAAVEIVHLETATVIERKIGNHRALACIRSSDTWDPATNSHAESGIGSRRTWIKASRPDLVGLRHALEDPDLRVRLEAPGEINYPVIEQVQVHGGFLDGQVINLSTDLNCLLGGTGSGKSLMLEAIRYTLDQQLDAKAFPKLWDEVDSRLKSALTISGICRVIVHCNESRFKIERVYGSNGSVAPNVQQQVGDEWISTNLSPKDLFPISAYSQGEILEHTRSRVGRMSLIDAGLDLTIIEDRIERLENEVNNNSTSLLETRKLRETLREEVASESAISTQVRELSGLLDTDLVKQQQHWTKEGASLRRVDKTVGAIEIPKATFNLRTPSAELESNSDVFDRVADLVKVLSESLKERHDEMETLVNDALDEIRTSYTNWDTRFTKFKSDLDARLQEIDPKATLPVLRSRLEESQTQLNDIQAKSAELHDMVDPQLLELWEERERLLEGLHQARSERRRLRRERIDSLNRKMNGFVRLDIPDLSDHEEFREALKGIKVGSRVKDEVLNSIAQRIHPLRFVRALWQGNIGELVNADQGIDTSSIARLLTNVADRDNWGELLSLQTVDRPDILNVSFKKPDDGTYAAIEDLSHGQRCTAILVIVLADGTAPVIVDQPEDALHAPWIETYLVDRLRKLRGNRQYLFATRSPGIVVSGDAEQIITMQATAGRGVIEASGSLERHDLNRLALHHLEGGAVPFKRRTRKLRWATLNEDRRDELKTN